jgi:outer membrane scaffolding protein for murein synthesis (MipA/OmpV family)
VRRLLVLIGLLTLVAVPAFAGTPDWTVDWGAVGRVRPAHLGSETYRTDLVPVLAATYGEDVSVSIDDGGKWKMFKAGTLSAGPVGEYRQSFNDDLPKHGFRTRDAIEVGAFVEKKTPVGDIEVRMRRALNGYRGWSGDLAFDTGGRVTPKLEVGAEARLSWADQRFTEEYFGQRRAPPSHFGGPHFHDNDYLTAGVQLGAAQDLTPNTRLVAEVTADHMLGELPSRGLFPSRDVFTASIGIVLHWSKSPSRSRS